MVLLCSGNPVDGLEFLLFEDGEEAAWYAENNFDGDWWIAPIADKRQIVERGE
jgi:hypothetical protein